jgi:hypothetical protein
MRVRGGGRRRERRRRLAARRLLRSRSRLRGVGSMRAGEVERAGGLEGSVAAGLRFLVQRAFYRVVFLRHSAVAL